MTTNSASRASATRKRETKLAEAARLFRSINDHVAEIIETAPAVLPALEATGEVTPASDALDTATRDLAAAYNSDRNASAIGPLTIGPTLVTVLGLLATVLTVLGLALLRDAQQGPGRPTSRTFATRRPSAACSMRWSIFRWRPDHRGNSQPRTSPARLPTPVNQAVEEMRTLVTTINETSVRVSASAQETRATALRLEEASDHQRNQIERCNRHRADDVPGDE